MKSVKLHGFLFYLKPLHYGHSSPLGVRVYCERRRLSEAQKHKKEGIRFWRIPTYSFISLCDLYKPLYYLVSARCRHFISPGNHFFLCVFLYSLGDIPSQDLKIFAKYPGFSNPQEMAMSVTDLSLSASSTFALRTRISITNCAGDLP